ncbi:MULTISPECIES: hypothetical protein [unclassified Microbispora]|nr:MULTISPECIES: hypothetical protein [unclassified Microbispora]
MVLLSVAAALLGTVIGVGFAWAGYEVIVKRALGDAGRALTCSPGRQ